jgi:Ca2+-binding EF-hand superfamily protein
MMATDMTASGSPEEKLRWAFKMYDKDGSGRKQGKFLNSY